MSKREQEIGVRLQAAMRRAATKVMHEFVTEHAGHPVHFLCDGTGGALHATVAERDGPWSFHRVGFCGTEPGIGPIGAIDDTRETLWGGVCYECKRYIEKVNGNWRVREKPDLKSLSFKPYEVRHPIED